MDFFSIRYISSFLIYNIPKLNSIFIFILTVGKIYSVCLSETKKTKCDIYNLNFHLFYEEKIVNKVSTVSFLLSLYLNMVKIF
jgi:hypothetical protein